MPLYALLDVIHGVADPLMSFLLAAALVALAVFSGPGCWVYD